MNRSIVDLRKDISELEAAQRALRSNRKPSNGGSVPNDLVSDIMENKHKLRVMYAAYGLLRGKKFSQIENKAIPVDKRYYEKYGYLIRTSYIGKHPLVLFLLEINECLERYGYHLDYEYTDYPFKRYLKKFNVDNCETVYKLNDNGKDRVDGE